MTKCPDGDHDLDTASAKGQSWCDEKDCPVIVIFEDGTSIREGDVFQVQRV